MRRDGFEHVIRAAADIVGDEIVVIGSQAILAQFPKAPDSLLRSQELDVFPRRQPERAGEIDGAIGDGSPFHDTYGYYAHGVGPDTPHAPAGWEERLVRVDVPAITKKTGLATAWCLEIHDLLLAKLAAGREHDYLFVDGAIRAGLADLNELRRRAELMPESHRDLTVSRLSGALARASKQ